MPSPIDLTDLEAVRNLEQAKGASGTVDDETVGGLITAASEAIASYTNREFVKTDAPETREFVTAGSIVDLAPHDLRAASFVTDITRPSSPTEVTDFRLRPKPSRHGVYSWVELRPSPSLSYARREREIAITGLWGFPEIPEDVRHWCGIAVLVWLRSMVTAFAPNFDPETGQSDRPEALPSPVRAGLLSYRRRPV